MKKAKKALLLVLCAALLVSASVMGTVAYLTSQDEVVNSFTVGKVQIKLDEAPVDAAGKTTAGDRVQANKYHLLPGLTYDKDPAVTVLKNSENCYVRMFVTINNSEDWDNIFKNYNTDTNPDNDVSINTIFNINEKWEYKGNTEALADSDTRTYEFWYKEVVSKNTTSDSVLAPLFTTVTMPGVLTNEDLALLTDNPETTDVEPDFKIYVVAQAIQSDGFADATAAFTAAPAITGENLMPTVDTTP